MYYIDTTVLLAFTLAKGKEIERYKVVSRLVDKINSGDVLGLTSFYALHEVFVYAIQNAPDYDEGCRYGKIAVSEILGTEIRLVSFLSRDEIRLHSRRFSALTDATDIPHAVSAWAHKCTGIISYDDHFNRISHIIPCVLPEDLIVNSAEKDET